MLLRGKVRSYTWGGFVTHDWLVLQMWTAILVRDQGRAMWRHRAAQQEEDGNQWEWPWKSIAEQMEGAASAWNFQPCLGGSAGHVLRACCFHFSLPASLSFLPHHSAHLSTPSSRKADTLLQLSGFFPWRISLIAPPDWVSLAAGGIDCTQSTPSCPAGKMSHLFPGFNLLFFLQLCYIFSGVKKIIKAARPKIFFSTVPGYNLTLL